jgi:hypothetical protein
MRYLLLTVFCSVFLIAIGCARPDQLVSNSVSSASNARPAPAPSFTPTPVDDAARITLEEAKKLYDEGKAFIVDARAEAAFKSEHIKSAVNITPDTLDAKLKTLPKDKTIIVYCS